MLEVSALLLARLASQSRRSGHHDDDPWWIDYSGGLVVRLTVLQQGPSQTIRSRTRPLE